MADKWTSGIKTASTSVSVPVILRQTTNNQESPGRLFSEVAASYWRQGGTRTAITTSALGSVNAAYSSGGWIQVDATNMPGVYRFDLPDAAIAAGSDWVVVSVLVSGCYLWLERYDLTTMTAQTQDHTAAIAAIQADTNDIQARLPATLGISGAIKADVLGWNGTAVATPDTAGHPKVTIKDGAGAGEINLTAGAVDSVTTVGSVSGAVGSVTGAVASVTGSVGSVTGNVGGNVVGSVGSVVGAVGSVSGAVGSVTGSVGSVAGNVSGNVVGSVGSVVAAVTAGTISNNAITDLALAASAGTEIAAAIWNALTSGIVTAGSIGVLLKNSVPLRVSKNTALVGFPFVMYDSTTDVGMTGLGAGVTCQRSLDGGAFTGMTNAAAEIGNGLYVIDLSAADTNANTITYRFSHATTKDTFVHIITEPPGV